MPTWSLPLSLALICCTASVQAQSCFRDTDCDSGKCCQTGRCAKWSTTCPCRNDNDCKFGEQCGSVVGVCYKPLPPPTYYIPTWDPIDPITYKPFTFNPEILNQCVWDSECEVSETCKDGKCVYIYNDDSGGFSWSGSKIVGIVLFVVVATIISCMYHMCKRARKPPNLPTRNVNLSLNAPRPTGVVGVEGNDHEMQSGNVVATNSTVVEVEDDVPFPPGAPPPYNSLEFESGQNENGNRNLPEQPPPSYDEAVRNAAMP